MARSPGKSLRLSDKLSLRIFGPTALLAVLLLGACTTAAVYLYREHANIAQKHHEDVGSRRNARELETSIENLIALLRSGSDQVDPLDSHIEDLITEARVLADTKEEDTMVSRLEATFGAYLALIRQRAEFAPLASADLVKNAIKILQNDVLPVCHELQLFNALQTEESEKANFQTVRWMAWGLAGVGGVEALAGIILGYSVARAVRRSIYRLTVRVRDAADRLGQDLPAVTLTRDGDMPQLHGQMERMLGEIERVVSQLQQREREVLRAEQLSAVGQLAAGAAHELRNPLTAIKMLIQTIREESHERGVAGEDLDVIDGEVRRMERCLQTFLDFARPTKPQRRLFDLAAVVQKTFAVLQGRARQQRVEMSLAAPEQPAMVDADAEQIQQLLVNLILNALDAMPGGGSVAVEITPSADGRIRVLVRDTGPGISPKLLPRLFEAFASDKPTGLGLGLVVSRRIAENHGGSLRTVPGAGGAVFELVLPAAATVAAETALTPALAGDCR